MKILVLKTGKPAYPEIASLVDMYLARLQPFVKTESVIVKDDQQAVRHLAGLTARSHTVLLDERGETWSSQAFAGKIKSWSMDPGVAQLQFIIGGPMGHPDEIRRMASCTWAISPATFTSDMAWLLVVEQIYRAYNIIKGTGYHHE